MDVKEFTQATLEQITRAIKENTSTLSRETSLESKHGGLVHTNKGWATLVQFDIAVTQVTGEKGGAKIQVVGIGGFGGDKEASQETVSRVSFRVPIEIYDDA